jgi:cyanophycin synthetase
VIDVTRTRALRGPNLWSKHTSVEALVQCDTQNNIDVRISVPDFSKRLRHLFPSIYSIYNSTSESVYTFAHALEEATLSLQIEAGCPVTFSRTTATPKEGLYQVVVQYTVEQVGRLAIGYAQELLQAALNNTDFSLAKAIAQLREVDEDLRLGPSTASIVNAGLSRNIPYIRLTEGSLVQLGWGSKQRRIQAAETDASSAIAESIAQDKELTKKLFRMAGLPVPEGRPVKDVDDAWAVAQEIGLPVVVKPQDGNQGKGVAVNVKTREELDTAYKIALRYREDIMVERYLPGSDYRLLVIGDKLVAAARREPALVVGDGKHSVRQLVDIVNADPLRGEGHSYPLTRIRIDEVALSCLQEQNLDDSSIPPKGMRVIMRNNANLSTGGSATDVTDDVHPEVAASAVLAAQMVGLDICGVDIVCETILRPLEEQNGGIIEVNAAPGLRMHLSPSFGKGRDVGKAVIEQMFPDGENGRIPVVAVTGTNGKTTTVRLISHLLASSGFRMGIANTDGVYANGYQFDSGDCAGPQSALRVLMHPNVDAAVLETARGGMLREGLAFDRCQVAVVTNIGSGDHLGLNYISTVEDLAVLKRVIVRNVDPSGMAVLNAEDPLVVAMAAQCPSAVTFFAYDVKTPALATHRAQGKRVLFVEGDHIVAAEGKFQMHIPLAQVPITHNGALRFQVANVMAAIAAGWALKLNWEGMCEALSHFVSDAQSVPGRFNVFDYKQAKVIVDFGHNADAVKAIVEAVNIFPAHRRSVVICGTGDRRDEDLRALTRNIGHAFDDVILFEDACQRGRSDGEVIALLREGLQGATRVQTIEDVYGEFKAIDRALEKLQPGDVCLILIDQIQESMAHVQMRMNEAPTSAIA